MKALLLLASVVVAQPPFLGGGGGGGPPFGGRGPFGGGGGGRRGGGGQKGPKLPPACQADLEKMAECLDIKQNAMMVARKLGVFGPNSEDSCLNQAGCDRAEFQAIVRDVISQANNPNGGQQRPRCRPPNQQGGRRGPNARVKRQPPFMQGGGPMMEPPPCPSEELRECIRDNIEGSIRSHMKKCMSEGGEAPPKGSGKSGVGRKSMVVQLIGGLMSNKDRLMDVCSDPPALVACAKQKIGEEINEEKLKSKCACFTGPSQQCKDEIEAMRKKKCACFGQVKTKLQPCEGTGNFQDLVESIESRVCSEEPPKLPQKPPICNQVDEEDDEYYY